jgi:predicted ATPase
VIQFLKTLEQENLLEFDYARRQWTFRLEAIARTAITDNIVDLMTRKIMRLEPETQRVLTLAACIGNQFELHTLSTVSRQPLDAASAGLAEAVDAGLLLESAPPFDPAESGPGTRRTYTFLHDRCNKPRTI